ncbi:UDP-N-acetylmuramate--L-alanine ligase [Brackiella oedipodis]|uniref:UDP-N-acetylmuramate--L-alanine ligase n=1 Tax=Brackiella oedipodis TaxID=124225 RepID=UPI00048B2096|nr:UDP-N-acetylmuramate--L-alanine ligase [Brackiella oedipodis]
MKHRVKHIHFVGIGGSGMSGIAEILLNLGYKITGSDLNDSAVTRRLEQLGATVYHSHEGANVGAADAVVVSTAITGNNPEVLYARAHGIAVVPRAMMLAELMRLKQGIAVAGTHGKTTTTSLTASILAAADLDPTFVIGGKLNSAGANAYLGKGDFIVVEADESDASFLNLLPVIAVVTNIDMDHMDTYGHEEARLRSAFVQFVQRLPFYGSAILCSDCPNVSTIIPFISRPVLTYGFKDSDNIQAINIKNNGTRMHFDVKRNLGHRKDCSTLSITLNMPGRHNVLNALAAIAVATELDVSDQAIISALEKFNGVGRRFSYVGDFEVPAKQQGGKFTVIDDYGHHPVEMAATIAAARGAWPDRRLVLAFQPHRYTRTRDCFVSFVNVLSSVDEVLLTDVYSAGEAPISGATGADLCQALQEHGKLTPVFTPKIDDLPNTILNFVKDGDVVLVMGAGSISKVPAKIQEMA